MAHTGSYGHKGKSIEDVSDEQQARMKTFKGSKPISSQWLLKNKPVKETIDAWYQADTPREKP